VTATIIAVGTLAKQAVDATQAGIRRYKNAPTDIFELSCQVKKISFIVESISDLCRNSNLNIERQLGSTNLEDCLEQTCQTLNSIKDVFTSEIHQSAKRNACARVKSAFYKEAQIKEWNMRLQSNLLDLTVILSLVSM